MKYTFIIIATFFSCFGCHEIMPVIPPVGPPELGDRKVLIEEFTGVRCVNCPDGSAEIENLRALYGENLVAVSIHSGFFSEPYPDNLYDFRTPDGDQLLSFLGEPLGYPTAVIDRKLFNGEADLQIGKSAWAGYIEQESEEDPLVRINATTEYNAASRVLTVTVTVIPNVVIENELALTVMLTESGIKDLQYTPSGFNDQYEHNHVLRKILSNVTGDNLGTSFGAGEDVMRTYTFTLPDHWVAENSHVIAFVHKGSGNAKDVLQVEEAAVVE